MEFRCAALASASSSQWVINLKQCKGNTIKHITKKTTMIYLLTKSRSHELSSTLHTRHRKTSLIVLHKILSPWLFSVSMDLSSFILSSLASLKTQLFMSSFENERKSLKINKALVPHFLLLLPAVPHPMVMLPADLPALSLKEWVRTPVKVKKAQVYSKKLTLG